MILVFFEAFVAALGLDIKVGPSKNAATTSFKVVVRELSDLRAAQDLWLEMDVLQDLFPVGCVDLGINRYFTYLSQAVCSLETDGYEK